MSGPALRPWPRRAALVVPLAVAAGAVALVPGAAPPAAAAGLTPWPGCDALLDHYRTELVRTAVAWEEGHFSGDEPFRGPAVLESTAGAAAPVPAEAPADAAAGGDAAVGTGPTGTNLQEPGVDEPDLAKRAGDLLLVSSSGRLQVLRAGRSPQLLATLPLGDGAHDVELLVDGERALAVVSGWRPARGAGPAQPEPGPVEPGPVEPGPVEPGPVEPAQPDPEPLKPGQLDPGPVEVPPVEVPVVPPQAEPLPEPDALPEPDPDTGEPELSRPESLDRSAAGMPAQPADTVLASPLISPVPGQPVVRLVLVDLATPHAPQVLETLELDGRYVSARLVDGTVRLVTSSAPQLPFTTPVEPAAGSTQRAALRHNRAVAQSVTVEQVLPQVVRRGPDGGALSVGPAVACHDVARTAAPAGAATLLVTTLRPAQGLTPVHSTGVTTDGDLVYASRDRLYVATTRWGTAAPADRGRTDEAGTEVHAFDTSAPDQTSYLGSGSVRGYVYGRWALSAHEGHLRVATTRQPPWEGGERSSSSLVVLAEDGSRLVEVGRVDGLGVDERIYAVRYLGDLAAVVTFRETDPLYVLDLSDPRAPRQLGELKIPGFSTYLHPVGGRRLLGIGQDADQTGRVTGFQLSLFDLSDPAVPVQLDRLSLGQGWSPAQEDSRAFGFDPQRGLAVLPFATPDGRGQALGVRVEGDRLVDAGRLPAGHHVLVQRVLLGDDVVHAVTDRGVVAGDAADLRPTGSASFG